MTDDSKNSRSLGAGRDRRARAIEAALSLWKVPGVALAVSIGPAGWPSHAETQRILAAAGLPVQRIFSARGLELRNPVDGLPFTEEEADWAFAAIQIAALSFYVEGCFLKVTELHFPRNIEEAKRTINDGKRLFKALEVICDLRGSHALEEVWPGGEEGERLMAIIVSVKHSVSAMLERGSRRPEDHRSPPSGSNPDDTGRGSWWERLAELQAQKRLDGSPLERFIRGPLARCFSDIYLRAARGPDFVSFAVAYFDAIGHHVDPSTIDRLSRPTPPQLSRGNK